MSSLIRRRNAQLEWRRFEPGDYDVRLDTSVAGLTITCAGKPVAIGGIVSILQNWWCFFDVIDEVARRPVVLHRTARQFFAGLDRAGVERCYAQCDHDVPNAAEWMRALGFVPMLDEDKPESVRQVERIVGPAWIRTPWQ